MAAVFAALALFHRSRAPGVPGTPVRACRVSVMAAAVFCLSPMASPRDCAPSAASSKRMTRGS